MATLGKKLFGILVWLIIIYALGILIFTRGFLLKRLVIDKNSTCQTDFTMHSDQHGEGGCWMHPRFKKAVVIVIDALRFDFVQHNASVKPGDELPFQNKLKSITKVLEQRPEHAMLYKFIADPPTTTMQRLKGLTTGSLPTFVDAGANFAKEEITEDNFIDQLLGLKKNLIFMGDDTWQGLFPNRFLRSYNYPSLNVKDLDTVDNGVIEHLQPEMKRKDWDMIIGHFLGVDHCGHTFGPYHPKMAEKMVQMDKVIGSVMDALDDDTVLFLMGDHGMTRTGDHGGDSADELDAALFVYSKQILTKSSIQKDASPTVNQIDLVPTISLLLGSPIPFSNLGMVMPDLFTYCPWWGQDISSSKQIYHAVKALHVNAHQVRQYLQSYGEVSAEFPTSKYAELEWIFQNTEKDLQELVTAIHHGGDSGKEEKFVELRENYITYLQGSRNMCQDIWAKFDLGSMVLGIITVLKAILLSIFLSSSKYVGWKAELTPEVMAALTTSLWTVLLFIFLSILDLQLAGMLAAGVTGIATIVLFGVIVYKIITADPKTGKSQVTLTGDTAKGPSDGQLIFVSVVYLLYCGSLFSNSFVVFEDTVTSFLVQSLILFQIVYVMSKLNTISSETSSRKQRQFDIGRILTSPKFMGLLLALVFCSCIRLAKHFRACREEQWDCELSSFLQPISALVGQSAKSWRYFPAVAVLMMIPYGSKKLLQYFGNLNGFSPSVLCMRYGIPTVTACIASYWALQAQAQVLNALPSWQTTLLPKVAYVLVILIVITVIMDPLSLLLVKGEDQDRAIPVANQDNMLPNVYNHIKMNWRRHFAGEKSDSKPPMAYGLATVFSATVILLVVVISLLCAMLLGDGLAAPITVLLVALLTYLELHASTCKLETAKQTPLSTINARDVLTKALDGTFIVPVVTINILASHFFFATGHQATIANIHWNPAFVGFHGDHPVYAIPAILITMETFASHIICGLALPLVILWPLARGNLLFSYEKTKKFEVADGKGEYALNEDYVLLRVAMFRACVGTLVVYGLKMLATMCCAAILRRHLMVWKIFAPRFVYEGATFFIMCAVSLIVYLFMMRVDHALDKWVKKNDLSQ